MSSRCAPLTCSGEMAGSVRGAEISLLASNCSTPSLLRRQFGLEKQMSKIIVSPLRPSKAAKDTRFGERFALCPQQKPELGGIMDETFCSKRVAENSVGSQAGDDETSHTQVLCSLWFDVVSLRGKFHHVRSLLLQRVARKEGLRERDLHQGCRWWTQGSQMSSSTISAKRRPRANELETQEMMP